MNRDKFDSNEASSPNVKFHDAACRMLEPDKEHWICIRASFFPRINSNDRAKLGRRKARTYGKTIFPENLNIPAADDVSTDSLLETNCTQVFTVWKDSCHPEAFLPCDIFLGVHTMSRFYNL